MTHSRPSAPSARKAALTLLDKVLGEGRLLSDLTAAPNGPLTALDPADRARAQRLALDTLRGMERADRLLQKHLRKSPPLTVRNILRLGTVELCQGGDAHGVVNDAVGLAAASGRKAAPLKGLVNAVLRKVAVDGPDAWGKLRVPRLPKWLRGPLVEAWGPARIAAMEAAHFAGAPLDLTLRGDVADWPERLGAELLPTGSLRLRDPGQISALPGYADGAWWVQDAAAALPALALNAKPGEKVLDLCAAPGGKTLQLAAAGAEVTALDISATRLRRLRDNLARTGLTARVVTGDAVEFDAPGWDAILLDAPCSATGTIRRHPDLPHARDGSGFGALIDLQSRLIDHALSLLAPGGRLVFCTCSLLPDEGEVQVEEALARHGCLGTDRRALALPGVEPGWLTEEGGLRLCPDLWPERGGMDGFYVSVLRKE